MVELKTFENGIRLLNEYIEGSHIFTIRICAMAGSKDEASNEYGFAHLLEHMTFKTTKKRTTKEISETLDRLGGNFNAYTAQEKTVFYITTITENAEQTIDCLCDIFKNTDFNEEELATEKTVVCSEIKMYEDDFPTICLENMEKNLYDDKLGHLVQGSVESVMQATPEILANFKKKNYTAGRIVVSTAGGITTDKVVEYIKKYLVNDYEKDENIATYCLDYTEPTPKQRMIFEQKKTDQVYCSISFPSINAGNEMTKTESLANILLGGCMSSRLFVGVREEKGLVYHISSSNSRFSTTGCNFIRFFSNNENAEKALLAIRQVLDKIKADGFTEKELQKAKSIKKSALVLDREKVSGIASNNLGSYIYKKKLFDLDMELKRVEDITLQQVNDRIREILNYDKFTFSIVAQENNLDISKYFLN